MTLLSERGLFWWEGEEFLPTEFAPSSSLAGQLTVENDGSSKLEFDGILSRGTTAALDTVFQHGTIEESKSIHGKLQDSNRLVSLSRLRPPALRLSSTNSSFETWFADICLVCLDTQIDRMPTHHFNSMHIDLAGFEDWIWLKSIKITEEGENFNLSYDAPESETFSRGDLAVSLDYDCWRTRRVKNTGNFQIRQTAELSYRDKNGMALTAAMSEYESACDFLRLLTGANGHFSFPQLEIIENKRFQLYFTRVEAVAPPFNRRECWLSYPQIKKNFGSMFFSFRDKKQAIAPVFYLYMGTMRGYTIYAEHLFVNLIWGLEALHRSREKHASFSPSLDAKIKRILDAQLRENDKARLERNLQRCREPTLAQRIYETLIDLPMPLSPKSVKTFSDSCARSRNDISHFGGDRAGGSYEKFIEDIIKKNRVLTYFYHAILLLEIGADPGALTKYFFEGLRAYQIEMAMAEFDILSARDTSDK